LRVEFLLKTDSGYFLNIGSASVLGDNYEQNGVIKGRGKVRWNRLGGHKMGGLYCGREAEISRSLRRTRNRSQEIENRGFRKRHKDRDIPIVLFCLCEQTHAERGGNYGQTVRPSLTAVHR